jgi:hypothetical protein
VRPTRLRGAHLRFGQRDGARRVALGQFFEAVARERAAVGPVRVQRVEDARGVAAVEPVDPPRAARVRLRPPASVVPAHTHTHTRRDGLAAAGGVLHTL